MDASLTPGKDYSTTPLWKKLGVKPGSRFAAVNAPDDFLAPLDLPPDVRIFERATESLDVLLFFAESRSHLRRRFARLLEFLAPNGGFWVAYPKKSAAVETDLTFDYVQQAGLDLGLVDNKSCSVDETWTAVRFVYRVRDRRAVRGQPG